MSVPVKIKWTFLLTLENYHQIFLSPVMKVLKLLD